MSGSLARTLASQGYVGEASVLVLDLPSGEVLHAEGEDTVFPAASLIKLPLLVQALELCQRGERALEERVVMAAADRVPGSGVLHELDAGLGLTLRDLLMLMIVVSDNTATNLVIGVIGLERAQAWLAAAMPASRLVGRLQLPPEQQNAAQQRGERNLTSARDVTGLLRALALGQLLDEAHTELALEILARQQYRDVLARHLPRDPAGEPLYRACTKSGELSGVHHDAGVLYTPRPLVAALLSRGGQDPREHPDNRDVTILSSALWPVLHAAGRLP